MTRAFPSEEHIQSGANLPPRLEVRDRSTRFLWVNNENC